MFKDKAVHGLPLILVVWFKYPRNPRDLATLSTEVRGPRTATGSKMFPLLACFCYLSRAGKLLFWCVLTFRYRFNGIKRHQKRTIQLPVAVRVRRTSVLKFPCRAPIISYSCYGFYLSKLLFFFFIRSRNISIPLVLNVLFSNYLTYSPRP